MAQKTIMLRLIIHRTGSVTRLDHIDQEVPMADEMVSAGKLAKEWGVSETAVKKAIKELGIEPDAKKGVCAMYGKETAAKIKKALK